MVEANLSNKLEEMAASIASLTEFVKNMPCHTHAVEDRVSRLEGLFVCTPSPTVDEVLDEMLSKSRADRTPDRIHKYAACVDNFSGDGKTQIAEPEVELSPAQCELFNIFDDDEEHKLPEMRHAAVQATAMAKKPRRGRCHGRASQTDPYDAVDAGRLTENKPSVNNEDRCGEKRDGEQCNCMKSGERHELADANCQTEEDITRKILDIANLNGTTRDAHSQTTYPYQTPPTVPIKYVHDRTDPCNIKAGDLLVANTSFQNAFESGANAFNIGKGTLLVVAGFDHEGDALVFMVRPDQEDHTCVIPGETSVLKEDLRKCCKILMR